MRPWLSTILSHLCNLSHVTFVTRSLIAACSSVEVNAQSTCLLKVVYLLRLIQVTVTPPALPPAQIYPTDFFCAL